MLKINQQIDRKFNDLLLGTKTILNLFCTIVVNNILLHHFHFQLKISINFVGQENMTAEKTHKHFPIFTTLLSVVAIIFYVSMSLLSNDTHVHYPLFEKFGAPYAIQIYDGQYWGVVVNSLIHSFPLHIITNLIGLWVFAAFLERRIGWFKLFLFGLFSSIFTSLNQLGLTNDAGLGLSGVNYALFGLIFVLALKNPFYRMKFHLVISLFMVLFLGFSIYMNLVYQWYVGIEAQLSGLFWGALIGITSKIKNPLIRISSMVIPFSLSLITLFYCPWSSMWQCYKGIELHEAGNIDGALAHYSEALTIEPDNKIALMNINLIKIDDLAKLAYEAHKDGRFVEAHRYYLQILALDKHNAWARNNMRELP